MGEGNLGIRKLTGFPDDEGVMRDERSSSILERLGMPTVLAADEGGVTRDGPSSKAVVDEFVLLHV